MVLALAGRRVDPAGAAPPRFPAANIERVRRGLRATFEWLDGTVLVSSAACGADLIALAEARRAGLPRRIVLPTSVERFRGTSVVDRGSEWGPLLDELISDARQRGDLVLAQAGEGDAAYAATNDRILDEAVSSARRCSPAPPCAPRRCRSRGRGTSARGSSCRSARPRIRPAPTASADRRPSANC